MSDKSKLFRDRADLSQIRKLCLSSVFLSGVRCLNLDHDILGLCSISTSDRVNSRHIVCFENFLEDKLPSLAALEISLIVISVSMTSLPHPSAMVFWNHPLRRSKNPPS